MNLELAHEWLKLLELLRELSANHYGNKHCWAISWDFVNTQESRISHISWLLFVDCTTILPNLYSWLKFSCSVVNPFSICNTIRCTMNFLQNIPKIFCSWTINNYEGLLLSCIFHRGYMWPSRRLFRYEVMKYFTQLQ